MSKPDASKQHKPGSIIGYREAIAHGNGPYRCNCELSFKSPGRRACGSSDAFLQSLLRAGHTSTASELARQADKTGARQMTDSNKLQQDRIMRLTDGILAVLTGADSAEADTALTLAVIASVYWRTSDAAMCLQAADGFAQQVRELVQHEDIIERIETLITRAL